MIWQKLIWTLTILAIWIVSLILVESSAKQTQLGYQLHQLQSQKEVLLEENLRLRSEIATLYDLEKAEEYGNQSHFQLVKPDDIEIIEEGTMP